MPYKVSRKSFEENVYGAVIRWPLLLCSITL